MPSADRTAAVVVLKQVADDTADALLLDTLARERLGRKLEGEHPTDPLMRWNPLTCVVKRKETSERNKLLYLIEIVRGWQAGA